MTYFTWLSKFLYYNRNGKLKADQNGFSKALRNQIIISDLRTLGIRYPNFSDTQTSVFDLLTEYCWIGLLNPDCNPIWWIGLTLSIQFCHFNPNSKYQNYFIKKLKFHSASCSNNEAKLLFKQLIYQQGCCKLIRCLSGIPQFHHKTWLFNVWFADSTPCF